jgi:hypothetical protein
LYLQKIALYIHGEVVESIVRQAKAVISENAKKYKIGFIKNHVAVEIDFKARLFSAGPHQA